MALFIPPMNFGLVENDLYRSAQPNELNFPFLETLSLKTILYLGPDEPPTAFQTWMAEQGIEFVALDTEETQKQHWIPTSEDVVVEALSIILDKRRYPLSIMCHLGRHRTGIVVGCLRKLQHWTHSAILEEYRRYTGSKQVRLASEQFIELFDTDLVRLPAEPIHGVGQK
eukprot:TRINITY_DN16771_c0_g1_i1.p2 TRINITY_DN16771_c0_g1~~TRINITY_DN16771_c0_g1_i1.p2  ORF type:complete len:178 (+),score=42.55 TRINITY_DN16771_c0_g1_i1:26-535(+)